MTHTLTPGYPLAVIDFEASSLDRVSYPIEVGLAVARDADSGIETWSTLICPDLSWALMKAWDPDAQRIHGIRPGELVTGATPAAALATLNSRLAGVATVWCGDGPYDLRWFATLCGAAAPEHPVFQLRSLDQLLGHDTARRDRLAAALAATSAPHRAGPDAQRLCRALITVLPNW